MTKVGINGFGRIGREVFRVAFNNPEVEVVAVNDPGDITALAHLLKYDSIHGTFNHEVSIEGNYIIVDDRKIEVFACLDPAQIPWGEAGAEIVVESTGRFTEAAKAGAHLHDTVKRLLSPLLQKAKILPSLWVLTKTNMILQNTTSFPTLPAPPTAWLRSPKYC